MALLNTLFFVPIIIILKYLLNNNFYVSAINLSQTKWKTTPKDLSQTDFLKLSQLTDQDFKEFNETLDKLLIPRVSGSEGNRAVGQYITDYMRALDWSLHFDEFNDKTPYGSKRFSNIVATLNPNACKRLVLSCHYDSMLTKSGRFVGAIDSAVPCAMILQIVRSLDPYLKSQRMSSSDTTLQLIFFDGEEAFVKWSHNDSLYGSRHLANTWNSKKFLTTEEENRVCGHLSDMNTEIARIEVMVLLDLLGAKNPIFYSHFPETKPLYNRIVEIETKLNQMNRMETDLNQRTQYFNDSEPGFRRIEDDHTPFVEKGVPILHIIQFPFPEVWHKDSDNRENVDNRTTNNLLKIFKIFVSQFLDLDLN